MAQSDLGRKSADILLTLPVELKTPLVRSAAGLVRALELPIRYNTSIPNGTAGCMSLQVMASSTKVR